MAKIRTGISVQAHLCGLPLLTAFHTGEQGCQGHQVWDPSRRHLQVASGMATKSPALEMNYQQRRGPGTTSIRRIVIMEMSSLSGDILCQIQGQDESIQSNPSSRISTMRIIGQTGRRIPKQTRGLGVVLAESCYLYPKLGRKTGLIPSQTHWSYAKLCTMGSSQVIKGFSES